MKRVRRREQAKETMKIYFNAGRFSFNLKSINGNCCCCEKEQGISDRENNENENNEAYWGSTLLFLVVDFSAFSRLVSFSLFHFSYSYFILILQCIHHFSSRRNFISWVSWSRWGRRRGEDYKKCFYRNFN